MADFFPFPEIENAYQKRFIDFLNEHGLTHKKWLVVEKAHGANFRFECDGEIV